METQNFTFFGLSALIFTSFLLTEIILLKKVPISSYELSNKVVLGLYNLSFLVKMVTIFLVIMGVFDSLHVTNVQMINNISSQTIWLTLCYFSLELSSLRVIIQSKTLVEYQRNMRRHKVSLVIAMVAQSAIAGLVVSSNYFRYSVNDEIETPYGVETMIVRITKIVFDLIIIATFLRNLNFFVRTKQEKLSLEAKTFSSRDRATVGLCITLVLLHLTFFTIVFIFFVMKYSQDSWQTKAIRFICRPLIDFITGMSVLWFLHNLAYKPKHLKSKSLEPAPSRHNKLTSSGVNSILEILNAKTSVNQDAEEDFERESWKQVSTGEDKQREPSMINQFLN